MTNPWLAIDVATAPSERARELRRQWERFVGAGEPVSVRAPIEASWRRSAAAGVDPSGIRVAPIVANDDEIAARWEVHPLAGMAPLIRSCLAASADDSRHLIVVSDENGVLLWVEGNSRLRLQAADSMNFAEGTLWSEGGAGTNAIGTALAAEHAVQVFASEHFNEVVQAWTCAAAPVHDPETGRVVGVIDLTGEFASVHPHSMAVATATAAAVEGQLRCWMLDRDARLLARHGDYLTAGPEPRALVAASGRVIASRPLDWLGVPRLRIPAGGGQLIVSGAVAVAVVAEPASFEEVYLVRALDPTPLGLGQPALSLSLLGRDRAVADIAGRQLPLRARHSEILTLLCAHPDGLSSEELSAGLYGEPGHSGVVRVEISRLRKLLGDVIEPEHYRLRPGVTSDVAEVCGLLHHGRVREAAARYEGPMLPHSHAPGVVREREALEDWMRRSVLSSGDRDAVWSWLQSATGAEDLAAWARLLADLPFHDPRRSLAATRVAALRAR
jgi:GAF domain-containing protein